MISQLPGFYSTVHSSSKHNRCITHTWQGIELRDIVLVSIDEPAGVHSSSGRQVGYREIIPIGGILRQDT